jgi:hypothetical protein
VAVTAGTVYQAYSFFANITAVAGRTATVQIDWYAVASGGTALSSSIGTATTLATATTWNTPPPQITAAAPAGALYAAVTLTVTGLAAGAGVAADVITIGLPYTVADNILPYVSSSLEQDLGGWSTLVNSTVGRSTASSREGWYSLLTTSVAAGVTGTRSPTFAVTAGVEYVAQSMVQSDSGTLRIELRWYDASSTALGTVGSTRTAPVNTWTLCAVVGTAPPGATQARVVFYPTATAAGQTWLADLIAVMPTSTRQVAGNLVPYSVADVEVDTSGWTVTGGTATQSDVRQVSGYYSMSVVAAGGDLTVETTAPITGVTAGLGYQMGIPIYQTGTAVSYQTRVMWLNAAGDAVRTRWQTWSGLTGDWRVGYMGDIAPADAVSVKIAIIVPGAPAGLTFHVDRATFTVGGLTALATPAAGGGVSIVLRGLSTGGPTWRWTLERYVGGEPPAPVRGWSGDLTSVSTTGDIAAVTDYEAPLGVPVQYYVRTVDPVTPTQLFRFMSDPVTLEAQTLDVWLKDPTLPARSVHATVQTLPDWQRAARQGVNQIRGRVRPIVISDVRSSRTGTLTLVTHDEAEKDELWWVLESGNTLLLQWPPGWGERDTYVSVGDVTEAHVTEKAEFSDRTWSLALTEVDRPYGGMVGSASRTWQTVADSGATWADVLAGYATWLDVFTGV